MPYTILCIYKIISDFSIKIFGSYKNVLHLCNTQHVKQNKQFFKFKKHVIDEAVSTIYDNSARRFHLTMIAFPETHSDNL